MRNRLCELLDIQYPILQGAMQWLSLPELAAAVSEAGGLGIITAASFSGGEELSEAIRLTRKLTNKPFAVNISLLPSLAGKEKINEYFSAVLSEKPPVVETSGQNPGEYLACLKSAGIRTIHKVPSVRFAKKAEELGVDAVVVVGFECGGHPGNTDTASMVQIARAARELSVPLIAGGGIADGAGLAAAFCLGADGAVMGTRFIASEECVIHPAFQKVLCAASEEDTVLVQRSIKIPLRVWKNSAAKKVIHMEAEGEPLEQLLTIINGTLTKNAYKTGDAENCAFPIGQCAGLIQEIRTVRDIIRETITGAARILEKNYTLMSSLQAIE